MAEFFNHMVVLQSQTIMNNTTCICITKMLSFPSSASGNEICFLPFNLAVLHIMGMEVVDSKLALDGMSETDVSAEVGKVDIKFGTHGAEEPAKGVELNKLSESNLPKDVVDEWPEPAQIHSFYIVRYRAFEDQNLKAKLDMADKDLQKKNQARSQIFEKLKTKRVSHSALCFACE